MEERRFLYNTVLLTASSILMSWIGMVFQVWLAGRIGAAGIGLVQLTLSVTNLFATFAISGIRFASTRLIAEELGAVSLGSVRSAMARCLGYAAFFGLSAGLILCLLAAPLGAGWIGDERTVLSLRAASVSMPCIALSASLSGYFTACGRVWKSALIHLFEQLTAAGLIVFLLQRAPGADLERSCAAVALGNAVADLLCLLLMAAAYLHDRRRHYIPDGGGAALTGRLLRLALPLALSAYARSSLSSLQHLMVPRGLRAAGLEADRALSGYGIVHGMALPVLFFPSCVLSAAAELIVPRLTRSQVRAEREQTRQTAGELCRASLLYSLAVSAFLFLYADKLGIVIYDSADAGHFIRVLAPLVPVMYTDMAVDGCLRGLGQQLWSMGVNILDALLGLLLVWRLLPRYALTAYIAILYGTELFNFTLSLLRLSRVMREEPPAFKELRSSRATAGQR